MVRPNVSFEPVLHQRSHYPVYVQAPAFRQVPRFLEVPFPFVLQLPYMREIDPLRVFRRHSRQIVPSSRSQAPRAERDAVVFVRHRREQLFVAFLPRYDPRQPEHVPRRVVRVDGHVYPRFVARRHDPFQKVHQIFKQLFVRYPFICRQQSVQLFLGVALVPPRQAQVLRVELHQRFVFVAKARAPVLVFMLQLRPQPVEHRHEVVTYALHSRFP